ncbi:D-alanine-D-alanyl carrier protein ligase [Bordetella ansorpii]|uniref:D-alanine-D-alanyl carrier protein ligase n=1 Tax=Bordetella ansorpii TaxID=288768 RepID=A0A157MG07_9BORD|nr:non-ribosomal peptide synthetase [Bordetella ansorpii]SAI08045.1 D-alanine-D-alanyl carrier protein ligase [Bordetella ansorpii]
MSLSDRLDAQRARLTPEQQALLAQRLRGGTRAEAPAPIPVLARRDQAPLSAAQQRQWFLWQFDPQGTAYHITEALHVQGRVDARALRQAFGALALRHESLRTVFPRGADGLPTQRILPEREPAWVQEDLHGAGQDTVRQRVQALTQQPFDLEQGPLLRVGLLSESDDTHILVVAMHHIVSDAWSMRVLVDEFAALYAAACAGQARALPELPVQYADYAAWQTQWLDSPEQARELDYWRGALGGEQPVLQLPAARGREVGATYRALQQRRVLPAELVGALRRHAQAHGATLFMALLAALQALLHRYAGQDDIRIGVPVANRHRPGIEGVIGLFVNTQVLRAEFAPRLTLGQLLDQARHTALSAQANQDLPFDRLVQALQPARSLTHPPLFQVMYNHLRTGLEGLQRLPGLTVQPYALDARMAQFDLSVTVMEEGADRVEVVFGHAEGLLDARIVAGMLDHYLVLLQALHAQPGMAVADVALPAGAHGYGLAAAAAPDAPCLPMTVQFEAQAQQRPDAVALVCGGQAWTYAALNERANRIAHRLLALGATRGARVGICLERGADMLAAMLAVMKAGAAYVPMDPLYPQTRLDDMRHDSGQLVLITQAALQDRFGPDTPMLVLDRTDLAAQAGHNPGVPLQDADLAYVIYTSGSTGKPKGVMVGHGALANFLASMRRSPGLSPQDRMLASTSLSFDIAALELYLPLVCGAQGVLADGGQVRDGAALAALIAQAGVTAAQFTPSGWRLLRAAGWPAAGARPILALCGGEALPPDLAQDLLDQGLPLWNLYGPTETTIWSAATAVHGPQPGLGGPIAATRLAVLTASLLPAPPGVAGELYIGGAGLARGYLHRPGLTAERFVADPLSDSGQRLYRTGDLARWRADGGLEYLGRVDHQVKLRGFRIELGEIEAVLAALPEVRAAVVVALERHGGPALYAYAETVETVDRPGLAQDLRRALAERLPDYMVPAAVVVLPALPLNANGKVDRRALPEPPAPQRAGYLAPEGQTETALAAIWSEVLGVPRVGRDDDFFELGGHSLLAVQVVSRVRDRLGAELALREVFRAPTLRGMARGVSEAARSAAADNEALSAIDAFMNSLKEE